MRLCAEQIPDVGSGPLDAPVLTIDRDLPIVNGELSFTLPQFYHSDAYQVAFGASSALPDVIECVQAHSLRTSVDRSDRRAYNYACLWHR